MDGMDVGAQPHCDACGTVLRGRTAGYDCATCGVIYLDTCSQHDPPFARVAIRPGEASYPELWTTV